MKHFYILFFDGTTKYINDYICHDEAEASEYIRDYMSHIGMKWGMIVKVTDRPIADEEYYSLLFGDDPDFIDEAVA